MRATRIELRPKWGYAWCHLGQCLRRAGQPKQALELLKKGHLLGKDTTGWDLDSAKWIADCEKEAAAKKKELIIR
jgi:hypothetical protein